MITRFLHWLAGFLVGPIQNSTDGAADALMAAVEALQHELTDIHK